MLATLLVSPLPSLGLAETFSTDVWADNWFDMRIGGVQVDPKMGYDEIDWSDEAKFIWGPDLEQSNTVLCRLTVE